MAVSKNVKPQEKKPKTDNKKAKDKTKQEQKHEDKIVEKKVDKIQKSIFQNMKESMRLHNAVADLKNKWDTLMINCHLYNYEKDTFCLSVIIEKPYGWDVKIKIPAGLKFAQIEEKREEIEEFMPCVLDLDYQLLGEYIEGKIITKIREDKKDYSPPPNLKPWQVHLGNSFAGESIIKDMTSLPHILDTGVTGSGKSKLIEMILTSLVANCDEYELELYLAQTSKGDLETFADCKQVRYFATKFEQVYAEVIYLCELIDKRTELIRPLIRNFMAKNYLEYNKFNPVNPMSTIYFVIDEFSSLMPRENGNTEEKKLKKAIICNLEEIIRLGRSVGINVIMATQRPTADMVSPFLKSQVNNLVTFRQINELNSRLIIDTPDAAKLALRQAIIKSNKIEYMKAPNIEDWMVKKYITPSIKRNHRMKEFDIDAIMADFNEKSSDSKKGKSAKQKKQEAKDKKKDLKEQVKEMMQNDHVVDIKKILTKDSEKQGLNNSEPEYDKIPDVTKEAIIAHNVSKIQNFVPYNPDIKLTSNNSNNKGGENNADRKR